MNEVLSPPDGHPIDAPPVERPPLLGSFYSIQPAPSTIPDYIVTRGLRTCRQDPPRLGRPLPAEIPQKAKIPIHPRDDPSPKFGQIFPLHDQPSGSPTPRPLGSSTPACPFTPEHKPQRTATFQKPPGPPASTPHRPNYAVCLRQVGNPAGPRSGPMKTRAPAMLDRSATKKPVDPT